MAIIPRYVNGAFNEAVFDFLADHDGLQPRAYSDSRGIPMLGISYAMLANTPGWPPRDSLERDLASIGIRLTASDRRLLISVGEALSRRDVAGARRLVAPRDSDIETARRFSFSFDREQARALFELSRPDVEMLLQRKLGRRLASRLAASQEMVALFSIAHDNPTLIGPQLVDALTQGARAQAWYEIRFGSNRHRHAPAQRRRDREAALFGLTNDRVGDDERYAVAALLDERRLTIRRYLVESGCEDAEAVAEIAGLYGHGGLDLPPCLRSGEELRAKEAQAGEGRPAEDEAGADAGRAATDH